MIAGVVVGTLMLAMSAVLIGGAPDPAHLDAVEWPGGERAPKGSVPVAVQSLPATEPRRDHSPTATPTLSPTAAPTAGRTPARTRGLTPARRVSPSPARTSAAPVAPTGHTAPTPTPSIVPGEPGASATADGYTPAPRKTPSGWRSARTHGAKR